MTDERDDVAAAQAEDDSVGQLLRLAGHRPAPPEDVAHRVRQAVHAEWQRARRRRSHAAQWLLGLGLAASVLLALGVWRHWNRVAPQPQIAAVLERVAGSPTGVWMTLPEATQAREQAHVGRSLPAGAIFETGSESRAALRLSGGASVRVDAHSRLTVVAEATLSLERGAVYVDSDPTRHGAPVEVRTVRGIAREQGTQFEVRIVEPEVRLRVREGAVRLEAGGRAVDARGGDEVRTAASEIARSTVARTGQEWSWVLDVAPTFALEGRSLTEFLDWACRENGWTLRYADAVSQSAAGEVVLHGSLRGLNPAEAVSAVLPTVGFSQRLDNGSLVLARAVPKAQP
jgi:ferric-dicitrate binding protein FerR (iron transport regulator)